MHMPFSEPEDVPLRGYGTLLKSKSGRENVSIQLPQMPGSTPIFRLRKGQGSKQ